MLLEHGADLRCATLSGMTPLMAAAQHGFQEVNIGPEKDEYLQLIMQPRRTRMFPSIQQQEREGLPRPRRDVTDTSKLLGLTYSKPIIGPGAEKPRSTYHHQVTPVPNSMLFNNA